MALKSITLRLDEEEYEKLKAHLAEFGDPDINVAFVLRSYIRDLNRALPFETIVSDRLSRSQTFFEITAD